MHDHRRSNVPVQRAAAFAAVLSDRERFNGDDPALGARLGSSSRIDHHDLTASVCSFVGDQSSQLSPRGVVHMLRQHSASEALNVQIFNRNTPEAVDELAALFVQEVSAARRNVRLMLSDCRLALAPDLRAAFAASQRTLQDTKPLSVALRCIRAANRLAVAQRDQRRKPKVNANAFGAGTLDRRDLDVKYDIPLASIAREDCRRRLARKFAVPADLDLAWDADETEFARLPQCQTITNAEVCGVVSVAGAEAGEACLVATFDAAEEGFERLIELAHDLLLRGGRPTALMRKLFADQRKARDLLVAADRDTLLVGQNAVLKSGVVKLAEVIKHLRQESGLRLVGFDPVAVAQNHGSTALLGFDVLSDRRLRDVPDRAREVGSRPQRRETRTQVRKLLTQEAGCRTLEAIDDLGRRARRVGLDKQVNVIRHHFHFVNEKAVLCGDLIEQNLEALIDGRNENRPTILRAPNDVILEAENSPSVVRVSRSLSAHARIYTRRTSKRQHLAERKGAHSAVG